MVEIQDRLTSLELCPLLATREIGRRVHYYETVDSTNRVAFELACAGAAHGEVVIAETQTGGKGRRLRSWSSPPKNLYCSVILRSKISPAHASELTLVAAVALAQTMREAGGNVSIKWPNDIEISGKKVAGILAELSTDADRMRFAILGMGANLNATVLDYPPEVAELAISLKTARNATVPRAQFTAALLLYLEQWLDIWSEYGFRPVREAWKVASEMLGREVTVRSEQKELQGIAEDIDENGALILRMGGISTRLFAGDIERVRSFNSR